MLFASGPYRFENFIEETRLARSADQLFEMFQRAMTSLGYDRVNFSVLHDPQLPPTATGFAKYSTYPTAWLDHYNTNRFQEIDPVVRFAVGNTRPFRWSDLEKAADLSRKQIAFLREGEEAGLHNGIGIPFIGSSHQIGGVALATSERRAGHSRDLDLLAAYCNHFYTVYKRLVGTANLLPALAVLTDRERDILLRIAHGRSDNEIANVLDITPRTVDFHLKNIFTKFDVHTRAAAVALAVKSGLLEL
jgi:DNA-binding CsgD family transcriptional regulator